MNKKYIIAGITFCFILVSGILYSCAFRDDSSSNTTVTSLLKEEDMVEQNAEQRNNQGIKLTETNQTVEQVTDQFASNITASDNMTSEKMGAAEDIIYIHLCGAVLSPGVYQVEPGARLIDLIELSGGLSKDAAGDYINQAQLVEDGQRIYIPNKEEVQEITALEYVKGSLDSDGEQEETSSKLININTATTEEFMELPGIGQAKADSIIKYRAANGNFKNMEELKNVPGIKEGLFGQISSYITVK